MGRETEKGRKTLAGDLLTKWLLGVTRAQFLRGTVRDQSRTASVLSPPKR